MEKLKKILSAVLVFVIVISLTAGFSYSSSDTSDEVETSVNERSESGISEAVIITDQKVEPITAAYVVRLNDENPDTCFSESSFPYADSESDIASQASGEITSVDEEGSGEIAECESSPLCEVQEDALDETEDVFPLELDGLLPQKEVNASLVLASFSNDELSSVEVSYILEHLVNEDGDKIVIPDTVTSVWMYFKDEENGIILDEYRNIKKQIQ